MRLLIIGGTRLIGRHLVAAALSRNHEVTLFNRGQHQPAGLTSVERIFGDRKSDLSKLQGRQWDAAIDTCGYLPGTVRASAESLAHSVERYAFISSLSVYSNVSIPGVNESSPLATLTNEQLDQANNIDSSGQTSAFTYGQMYGGLKVLCEQAVEEALPGRALIIRPGLIVGPHDYTDRLTYWVVRVAKGGNVLSPGRPDRFVQFIDARDLADWIVGMTERRETGIYNANGLPGLSTMQAVLAACKEVSDSNAAFTWVGDDFLIQENVAAWSEMPLWIPESDSDMKGFLSINVNKAIRAGLTFRPVHDTIKHILTWVQADRPNQALRAGIDAAKEQDLLRKLHNNS